MPLRSAYQALAPSASASAWGRNLTLLAAIFLGKQAFSYFFPWNRLNLASIKLIDPACYFLGPGGFHPWNRRMIETFEEKTGKGGPIPFVEFGGFIK